MNRPGRCRGGVVLLGVAVGLIAAGCTNDANAPYSLSPDADGVEEPASATEAQLAAYAEALKSQIPCSEADVWHDDMAFWDSMRGFDCFGEPGPTFVRVYAHEASVTQTLADWEGTFGDDRALARGRGWYVIGPPEVVTRVSGLNDRPRSDGDAPLAAEPTNRQDYLTTCTRFSLTEAERLVADSISSGSSREQYEELFPGVSKVVRSAVASLPSASLANVDEESLPARLSAIGPKVKESCLRS